MAIGAALFSCLTPSIKVRLKNTDSLENPTGVNIILLAKEHISIFNFGLIGTLKNGLGFPPLLSQPVTVLTGGLQAALVGGAAYGAMVMFPGFVAAHSTAIIAGALLAAL